MEVTFELNLNVDEDVEWSPLKWTTLYNSRERGSFKRNAT